MADQSWAIGFACDVQVDVDTLNATVAALSGSLVSSDGIVLGDRDSGEHNSGITLPSHIRQGRAVADVAGSLSKQDDSFLRVDTQGMQISVPLKGNGATSTPLAGEAKPLVGIDALLQAAGWEGANGAAPLYVYELGSSTIYLTVKLWVADVAYVYKSVACERFEMVSTPGGISVATFDLVPSSVESVTDGTAFPTFDYGTQTSLDAPVVQGVAHAFGQTRGFNQWTLTIDNAIADIEDSNQPSGIRKEQDERTIDAAATLFVDDSDSDFDYAQLVDTAAPSDAASYQVGTIAGPAGEINAYLFEMDTPRNIEHKATKLGGATGSELTMRATATAAGEEARLTFN
jgi:hypothetical protein